MKLPAKTLGGKAWLILAAGLLLYGVVTAGVGGDCGCEPKR